MQHIQMSNGYTIPVIGLGTWKSGKGEVGDAVKFAMTKAGYHHIDCASIYGNEKEIGNALHEVMPIVKREEVFITSKLWNTDHKPQDVEKACRKTLQDLRLDYLDLYLMHWGIAFPNGEDLEPIGSDGKAVTIPVSIQETWRAMEELVEKGLVKSIGVANFTTMMLIDLLTYAKVVPAVSQIELHPLNTQEDLLAFCQNKNITITAYSPLGHDGPKLFTGSIVRKLSEKYKKTPAQIVLRWGMQRNSVIIPKSITPQKIQENIDIFDFTLDQEEMDGISLLNQNRRFVNPIEWWGIPYFA